MLASSLRTLGRALVVLAVAAPVNAGAAPRKKAGTAVAVVSPQNQNARCELLSDLEAQIAKIKGRSMSEDEIAELRAQGEIFAQRLIEIAGNANINIDITTAVSKIGAEAQRLTEEFNKSGMMDRAIKDSLVKGHENDKVDQDISQLLIHLTQLKADTGNLKQGARAKLASIPFVGKRLAAALMNRVQSNSDAIVAIIAALDGARDDLNENNRILEEDIERAKDSLNEVQRSLVIAMRANELLTDAYAKSDKTTTEGRRLESFLKMLRERIQDLQHLEGLMNMVIAAFEAKIAHNRMGLNYIRRVKTVSVPTTQASIILNSATVGLDNSMRIGQAINDFNNQQIQNTAADIARQGDALRESENQFARQLEAIDRAQLTIANETGKQRKHDEEYLSALGQMIADRDAMREKLARISLNLEQAPPELLLTYDPQSPFQAQIDDTRQAVHILAEQADEDAVDADFTPIEPGVSGN